MAEIRLTESGQRVLREAEQLCYRLNVAIAAPEHLMAGALMVLSREGVAGLPGADAARHAAEAIHGTGESLDAQVMWGSAAREALNATARYVAAAGETEIDARRLALGILESGELNPMFFVAAGTDRESVRSALAPQAGSTER